MGAIALSYLPLFLLMTHHEETRLNTNRSPNTNHSPNPNPRGRRGGEGGTEVQLHQTTKYALHMHTIVKMRSL